MSVADRLVGYVVRAQDALWEAENIAIEHRAALPGGIDTWDLTSLKMDVDQLRKKLVAIAEAERAEQRRIEEGGEPHV